VLAAGFLGCPGKLGGKQKVNQGAHGLSCFGTFKDPKNGMMYKAWYNAL
jgi:hypothetical protein